MTMADCREGEEGIGYLGKGVNLEKRQYNNGVGTREGKDTSGEEGQAVSVDYPPSHERS